MPSSHLLSISLSYTCHLKQASITGRERDTGFFSLSQNPIIPGIEQRAKAETETAIQRAFVSCLAGFCQPPSLPQGLLSTSLRGERGPRWARMASVLHDDISALAGSVGQDPVLWFSWVVPQISPCCCGPLDHFLASKSPLVLDWRLLHFWSKTCCSFWEPHPDPSMFLKYVREPRRVFWLILKLIRVS